MVKWAEASEGGFVIVRNGETVLGSRVVAIDFFVYSLFSSLFKLRAFVNMFLGAGI